MVTVTAASGVDKSHVQKWGPYTRWLANLNAALKLQDDKSHKFHDDPYVLETIDFKAATFWGDNNQSGFVYVAATIKSKGLDKDGKPTGKPKVLPGSVFLRGDSVVIMIVVRPQGGSEKDDHVLMTAQPRVPAGSLAFAEFPAGMVDGKSTFAGTAADEIKQETGLEIIGSDLEKMSEIAFRAKKPAAHAWQALNATSTPASDENLGNAFYLSPGGCDESMQAFYAFKTLPKDKFAQLNGKETGVARENERITVKLVPLADAFFECGRDAKSLTALALYQNLKAKGLLKKR
ncbi:hypothetical protein K491DRAFT_695007 [Lophiostoma macrostomum CBS 122681]|uniref:Nudix hydrolase domain-containing protein n=1 Tax=Lophiostoma macrostomum CBS 122681 TaxID=1314788 RepID=A0A6A6T1W0_9PLEO|nr:hypothetical protein K491DRAFT_695007 [Lophiostoma macrostomum CBS 122681]